MQPEENSPPQSTKLSAKPSPSWAWWLVVGLLIAVVGVLGYLYWQEKGRSSTPSGAINTPCNCPKPSRNSSVEATVGKFKLSLQDYVIIRHHDGGFEGGPITSLSVGTKSTTGTNVIDYPTLRRVDVQAQPLNDSYQQYIDNTIASLQSPDHTELANITVAGETARVFRFDGLFSEKIVFFQHEGIVYKVRALQTTDPSDDTQQMLDAVVAGFSFL